jgi:hypothetical protein
MGSTLASNTLQNSGSLKMSRSSCIADNPTIDHASKSIGPLFGFSAHSLVRAHNEFVSVTFSAPLTLKE